MREGANRKGQAARGEAVIFFHPRLRSAPFSERILHPTFANCFSWRFDPKAFSWSPRSLMVAGLRYLSSPLLLYPADPNNLVGLELCAQGFFILIGSFFFFPSKRKTIFSHIQEKSLN